LNNPDFSFLNQFNQLDQWFLLLFQVPHRIWMGTSGLRIQRTEEEEEEEEEDFGRTHLGSDRNSRRPILNHFEALKGSRAGLH
jgi:hypothetical protein